MRSVSKKILYVVLGLAGAFVLWMVIDSAYVAWGGYKWQKQTDAFQAALSKPYREDTYGGKTPEETWGMFLDALKKGDVELASKYVVPEKREIRLADMIKAKEEGRLPGIMERYSLKLEKEPDQSSKSETAYFYLVIKNKDNANESYPIVFILNPYTKVWKISLL